MVFHECAILLYLFQTDVILQSRFLLSSIFPRSIFISVVLHLLIFHSVYIILHLISHDLCIPFVHFHSIFLVSLVRSFRNLISWSPLSANRMISANLKILSLSPLILTPTSIFTSWNISFNAAWTWLVKESLLATHLS